MRPELVVILNPVVCSLLTLPKQKPTFITHHAVDHRVIDVAAINLQPGPDPSVAICGAVLDHATQAIATFRSASSCMGSDFLKSTQSEDRIFN